MTASLAGHIFATMANQERSNVLLHHKSGMYRWLVALFQLYRSLSTDERRMNEMLWMQMRLPEALRKQGILFIHAQKKAGAARAETADCVESWVRAHHPGPGRALVVSNNPFIEYQRRVTEVLLKQSGAQELEVMGMGPEAELDQYDRATRLGLLLDALAGTLFRAKQQEELGLIAVPEAA